jgi:hypothetical protein
VVEIHEYESKPKALPARALMVSKKLIRVTSLFWRG